MTSSTWQAIRQLRASLPSGVSGDARAGVFRSALEQAEELMGAAEGVGAPSRPLPLFYSLSQAGRAIAAARLPDPIWRLAGHGLAQPADSDGKPLLRRMIAPLDERKGASRRSSFAGVADALGSDELTGPVVLGAVWAALPNLMDPPQMPGLSVDWRRPLRAYMADWSPDEQQQSYLLSGRPLELLLGGLRNTDPGNESLHPDTLLRELETWYPTSASAGARQFRRADPPDVLFKGAPTGELLPMFIWPAIRSPFPEDALDSIAPDYRQRGIRVLLPRLPTGDFLTPLMTWWVLLFGLSMVARYDPEVWVESLDVNRSTVAVPIETALDVALEAVPQLVLEALTLPAA